jgi:exopolysaccharide biosynthesis polyprenyl glycosylphosphotransferase
LIVTGLWLVAMFAEGLWDLDRVFWGSGEYSRVARAVAMGFVGLVLATFALKLPDLSREWTLRAAFYAFVFVVAGRMLVRWMVTSARRRGRFLRSTLIVGYNAEAADIMRQLQKDASSGLVAVGCLASSKADLLNMSYCDDDVPCLGDAARIGGVVDELGIDTVVIASTAFDHDVVAKIINDLRGHEVDIQLSAGLLDVSTSRILVRQVSGVPLITVKGVSFTSPKRFVKRTFDIGVGGLIFIVGLPIWLLIALAIRLDSRGPVLFVQERVGRGGKKFGMFKFRSMTADAEVRLGELADANEATGPLFKIKSDPRVTRVGGLLRRYSIDEFPQLLNVLRGEMSLVGPRPPLPSEVGRYSAYHWRRLEVLPGMTGLWQVSGRSSLTFEEMVRLDLFYIENWSVGFDMGLMLRTLPAVLGARGAY